MSITARILAIIAVVLTPACDHEDDDSGDGTDGTTTLPEGVTTASYTGATSPAPEPEYLCEAGSDCLDDSTCGEMECVVFSSHLEERRAFCAVPCDSDADCTYKIAAKCGDEGVCLHDDESIGGACDLPPFN